MTNHYQLEVRRTGSHLFPIIVQISRDNVTSVKKTLEGEVIASTTIESERGVAFLIAEKDFNYAMMSDSGLVCDLVNDADYARLKYVGEQEQQVLDAVAKLDGSFIPRMPKDAQRTRYLQETAAFYRTVGPQSNDGIARVQKRG